MQCISRDHIGSILQALYDSEINMSLSWCWDAGVEAKVFTTDSAGERWRFDETFYNDNGNAVGEAVRWIVSMVVAHDPSSEFAKRWSSGDLC